MKKLMMIKMMIILLFFTNFKLDNNESNKNNLTIGFDGVHPNTGILYFALYNNEEDFNQKKIYFSMKKKVDAKDFSVTLNNLPNGNYAIMCFQDMNNNHKLDFNQSFMPVEPWGLSNDKILMNAPTWDDAVFKIKNDTIIKISLK